jgi:hypothetical protein
MGLDGVLRHEHGCGDLSVGLALCDQGGDAALGFGKPVNTGVLAENVVLTG